MFLIRGLWHGPFCHITPSQPEHPLPPPRSLFLAICGLTDHIEWPAGPYSSWGTPDAIAQTPGQVMQCSDSRSPTSIWGNRGVFDKSTYPTAAFASQDTWGVPAMLNLGCQTYYPFRPPGAPRGFSGPRGSTYDWVPGVTTRSIALPDISTNVLGAGTSASPHYLRLS